MDRNDDRKGKTMSKVSIVVPCYKVEKYIAELIESIQRQKFRDIEVILVDDGSPDKTGAICDEYAVKDSRLHVIHKSNGGVSAARNDGMKAATGEYILFADSDDYLPENAIELLYTKAVQTDADIVIGDVNQVFADRERMGRFYEKEFLVEDEDQKKELIQAVFYNTYCPWPYQGKPAFGYGGPWNKLVRRKLLEENGIIFDSRTKGIFDDLIYSAYILAVAQKIAYIQQNVYNYRMVETSITNTYKKDMLAINQAIFEVWNEFLARYDQVGMYKAAYYANVLRRFDASLGKYFCSPDNPRSKEERKKELRETMNSEPYSDISKYVETGKLEKRHRVEYIFLKLGSAKGMWVFYNTVLMYRKSKKLKTLLIKQENN